MKGTQYWALNVLKLVPCLDVSRSKVLYSPSDPTRILSVSSVRFQESNFPSVPIFKLSEYPSKVFVRKPFVDIAIENGLRVSDTLLVWRAFVEEKRWMSLMVMVTYHTALVCLALSLL